jgi:hypothetical protein
MESTSMQSLAYLIFGLGWPVLIIGSVWLWRHMDHLAHDAKTFLNINLATFYLLGFVSTLYWLGQPWQVAVFPAFAIFLVLFVIVLRTTYVVEHQPSGDREAHA